MDVICQAMAAEMHSWSASAVCMYLSFAVIAFLWVFGHGTDNSHPTKFFEGGEGEQAMTDSFLNSG